jgi:hypothetical protein
MEESGAKIEYLPLAEHGGAGDFGFLIRDFILVDECVSGGGGPRVEPGAKRGGGPGGARAVF